VNAPGEDPGPTISDRDRSLILTGILLALFLAALDQTIVSTALPRIVEDLEGVSRYAWVATAYLLASTALVPLYGKLADTYSRKYVELSAIGLFLAGSMLCGLSGEFGRIPLVGDGMNQLVLFRGVQGAGGAGLFAMTFIVIADLFTPAERGRYQGLVGAVFGIASVLGPLVGGFLTDRAGGVIPGVEGWRWVFYVNVPVGAAALWFILRRMPPLEPRGERAPPDLLSAALLIGGLVPLIFSLQIDKRRFPWLPGLGLDASPARWQSWLTVGLFMAALTALSAFVSRSRRVRSPIFDLTLFQNRIFGRANAAAFFFGATFLSIVIFLPLYLVNVVGVSATRAGLALIPFSLGIVTGSTLAGNLVARIGHLRDLILAGGVLLTTAMALFTRFDADTAYLTVTAYSVLAGLGMGPSLPLFTLAIQNAVDVRRVGQATSAAQFFRQIGGTVGAATMGTVLATHLGLSFARLELPEALSRATDTSVDRLASTGGAALPERIRVVYAELASEVRTAVDAGDRRAIAKLATTRDLPDAVRTRLEDVLAEGGATAPPDSASSTDHLASEVRARGDEVAERVQRSVRQAFAGATRRIYELATILMLIALLLTLRMPELPLRRTHDRAAVTE
jgi:EmrB/QacA subfamily drug resistance transporter